jgi:hypothetical protein
MNLKIIKLLFLSLILLTSSKAYAQTQLMPLEVGKLYEYIEHDSDSPINYWTKQIEVLNTVNIGSLEYSNVKVSDGSTGMFNYLLFRSTEDTAYFYGDGTERPLWRMADIGTNWCYLDPDGIGTACAEIVSHDTLAWEAGSSALTVPYDTYAWNDVYIHKKYYGTHNTEGIFWYEYIVPGVGVVKDYNYEADVNPPHIMELTNVSVVPEPISSTLFIVGGATLGFRRFRKKLKA